jgi:hypothetical protein
MFKWWKIPGGKGEEGGGGGEKKPSPGAKIQGDAHNSTWFSDVGQSDFLNLIEVTTGLVPSRAVFSSLSPAILNVSK